MSMISEQVKHLKELSDTARANVYSFEALSQSLREAADTIEALSAKLQAANMERSADRRSCGSGCFYWDSMHGGCTIHNTVPDGCKDFFPVKKSNDSADCGGWIPVSERMPEEGRCIDPETGYYGRSDDVLCSAYNEYEMKDEIWIDYTIDGEWQAHEWYEGEKLAWMPLPASYRESDEP